MRQPGAGPDYRGRHRVGASGHGLRPYRRELGREWAEGNIDRWAGERHIARGEGLRPWQPQKLYYFSDASHTDFLEGKGPQFSTTTVSPARCVPYYLLAAEEQSFHLTQDDTGQAAKAALASQDFHAFQPPARFILGKSLVKTTTTGDIFEGVVPGPIPFAPVLGFQPQSRSGLFIELGGPWAFYREFWQAHNIENLAQLLAPEAGVGGGETLHVPLLLHNDSAEPKEVTLSVVLPRGWTERVGSSRYPVSARDIYPVEAALVAPSSQKPEWQEITWKAEANGTIIGSVTLRVYLAAGGLPQ